MQNPDPQTEIERAEDLLARNPDPYLRMQCALSLLKMKDKPVKRVLGELRTVAENEFAPLLSRTGAYEMMVVVALNDAKDSEIAWEAITRLLELDSSSEMGQRFYATVANRRKHQRSET